MPTRRVIRSHGIITNTWDPLCCDHRCWHLDKERDTGRHVCNLFGWMLHEALNKGTGKKPRLERCLDCRKAEDLFNKLQTVYKAVND